VSGPPFRWGVLGAANIARIAVIPAIQKSGGITVAAIASRDAGKARAMADAFGVPRAYGSYDELLADPAIDAVYNPLPNHLHVPWSIAAMEAGKHVLCEKPIGLNADDARRLLAVRDRTGRQVAEAFMVHVHPQWERVHELVRAGRIGELKHVHTTFSYFKRDPANVRSRVEWGGGALLDIGCYPVTLSRRLFGAEPTDVMATLERDPDMRIDRLASAILRFPGGTATFTVGGQTVPQQRTELFGTTGRIEVPVPVNTPPSAPARIVIDDGRGSSESVEFAAVDQYTIQAERFVEAVRGGRPVPVPLEDAIANMAVLDALFRSAETGRWERPA